MKLSTALRLGRVSNLPTVLTNAMAGMAMSGVALSGVALALPPLAIAMLAAALAYTAGMFLNDAFDADADAQSQRFRPIPAGLVTRNTVYAWGFAMLALSVALFAGLGLWSGTGPWPGLAGLILAAAIVGYNANHKENPFGPILMGLCRVLVYVAASLVLALGLPPALWLGALALLAHVAGLTYIAKQEQASGAFSRFWPVLCLAAPLAYGLALAPAQPWALPFVLALLAADIVALRHCLGGKPGGIGRAIPIFIAAIALLDAMLIAMLGSPLAILAACGFPLTLVLQRWVRGT